MLKVIDFQIGMVEVPDEISLTVGLTNCPFKCPGCHTPIMQTDAGEILDNTILEQKILSNIGGITCVCFLGGDNDLDNVAFLAKQIREKYKLKTAIYLGSSKIDKKYYNCFNFIKLGQYISELGSLNVKTTNQRFYKIEENGKLTDITHLFWKNFEK